MISNRDARHIVARNLGPILGGVGLVIPLPVFAVLLARPEWDHVLGSPGTHFVIVSVVALLAVVMAVAVLWASRTLPDPRTFFLAMAFLSMATVFLAHGLGTSPLFRQHVIVGDPSAAFAAYAHPGAATAPLAGSAPATTLDLAVDPVTGKVGVRQRPPTDEELTSIARDRVVGYSARLSLLLTAIFLALAVVDPWPILASAVLRHRALITIVLSSLFAAHVVAALAWPQLLEWLPFDRPMVSWAAAAIVWTSLGFAGLRFLQAYRLAILPLEGALAFGVGFLAEAQLFMTLGRTWQLSWWEYHVTMLVGFVLCVGALLRQYRMTGDLGVVVEGLFLRSRVSGIRAGDPRALGALAAAVAAKDTETDGHLARVGELTVGMARRLGLSEERVELVRWAGRLHDVGKIGVPNHILRKHGTLTAAEFEEMKRHTTRGYQICMHSGVLAEVAPIVRAHHERIDGRGYPDGLAGDAIPLEARIVAAADVWDALVEDRPYREAMTTADAVKIIVRSAGAHLDPACIDALFAELGLPLLEVDEELLAAA